MRLLGIPRLKKFIADHADVRGAIGAWRLEVEDAEWRSPIDVKARYPTASILSNNRVIFNIKGNNYRIETKVSYDLKIVLILRIGTHSEYTRWTL
jgi:mRNA interferase HigB